MRVPVELRRALRLINHGPTTLISSAAGDEKNLMAAAWVMPLDLDPPKLAIVIDGKTQTRALIEASQELVVNLPTRAMADLTYAAGSVSGKTVDKLDHYGVTTSPASQVGAPLIDGCAGWLECRVLPEPEFESRHDLFVVEVVAAWVDGDLWANDMWSFPDDQRRTIHHVARGLFFATGDRIDAVRR
jgi:flavin reductase (DIM6/NTAB) family NADH-FMN oxidoreductase RutF